MLLIPTAAFSKYAHAMKLVMKQSALRRVWLLVGWLALWGQPTLAGVDIRVAVAANFTATLEALAGPYEQASGNRLVISPGATGALYSQIANAAPFDVFLAADELRPRKLVEHGMAVAGTAFVYAQGIPVLWSPDAALIDAEASVLRQGLFRYLALAEPRTAPYGAAARSVLEALDLWDALERRRQLVRGSSVAQTHSQVASGAIELGFVALAQVQTAQGIPGSHWIPPAELYAPLTQGAVLLSSARARAAARHFLRWLQDDAEAAAIIEAAGYRRG